MIEIQVLHSQPGDEHSTLLSGVRERQVVPLVLAAQDEKGKLIGGLIANTFQRFAIINLIWFSADSAREQCGRRLIEQFEHIAARRDCSIFFIEEMYDSNAALYGEAGYVPVEALPGFVGEDQLRGYVKELELGKMAV